MNTSGAFSFAQNNNVSVRTAQEPAQTFRLTINFVAALDTNEDNHSISGTEKMSTTNSYGS